MLQAAAGTDAMPAAGFLDRLSALDGTTAAIEAMLEYTEHLKSEAISTVD